MAGTISLGAEHEEFRGKEMRTGLDQNPSNKISRSLQESVSPTLRPCLVNCSPPVSHGFNQDVLHTNMDNFAQRV